MTAVEFRRYVFRTPEQWQHGVGFRLQSLARGGFQLFSAPSFQSWVTQADEARSVRSLDVDESGRLLWVHRDDGHLYRRDPGSGIVEQLVPLAAGHGGTPPDIGRLLHTRGRVWIHDRGHRAFSRYAQTRFRSLPKFHCREASMWRWAAGGCLPSMQRRSVSSPATPAGRSARSRFRRGRLPLRWGWIPTVAGSTLSTACARGFLRFAASGRPDGEFARFDDISPTFMPHFLCVDAESHLFVSDGTSVHQFAADGGYIGHAGTLGPVTAILAITCGADGALYAADRSGIARFGRQGGVAVHGGHFYSGTLDSGSRWSPQLAPARRRRRHLRDRRHRCLLRHERRIQVGGARDHDPRRASAGAEKAAALENALGDLLDEVLAS